MSNALTLPSSSLDLIKKNRHITIEFPTQRRLSHGESENLCDQIEVAFASKGITVRASGGTNYGSSIVIDVHQR